MNKLSRRGFSRLAGAAVATSALGLHACAQMQPAKARVVVIGGGFGGATAARYIRQLDPAVEVTLIEPNRVFHTCPFSNYVLAGFKRMEDIAPEPARTQEGVISPAAESGIRAIIAADRRFDVNQFVEGARSAYRMILEAFWKGDRDELAYLCDTDVNASFGQAIDARDAEGHTLENRLIRIDRVHVADAALNGGMATITLRFDADIAAVTRDRDGNVIAGSMTDAVATHDVWTFARDIRSNDPNWKLTETDEAI